MSDSVQPYRWQPTRLPRPWDSPGKNTGVWVPLPSPTSKSVLIICGSQCKQVFPGGSVSKKKKICLQCRRPGFDPWVGKLPWRRKWQPTLVLLPGESRGWRSLVGCSPWGREESDTTFTFHFHALEKEIATHSSTLAWRIPGTGEPGGLPSIGLHRVGHD